MNTFNFPIKARQFFLDVGLKTKAGCGQQSRNKQHLVFNGGC